LQGERSREPQSRHEAFQDIIMKSKMLKLQKKEQKEELEVAYQAHRI